MSNFIKKISCVLIVALVCFLSVYPTKTSAQVPIAVPVFETNVLLIANTTGILTASNAISVNTARVSAKQTGLGIAVISGVPVTYTGVQLVGEATASGGGMSADAVGRMIVRTLIHQFTGSLVTWINHGFQGGPSFVTDPERFFVNIADRAAGEFIKNEPALSFLCDPFAVRLALNLDYSASFRDKVRCTLTDVVDNIENFQNDFRKGGWPAWFSMTQRPSNNPYGEYISARVEMNSRMMKSLGLTQEQLSQGGGFLSWRDCLDTPDTVGPPSPGGCVNYGPVKTPGKVIEGQLEHSLNANLQDLELAQDFDSIIGALVSQLMKQAITQAGGLLGA